jgi:predicted esterase
VNLQERKLRVEKTARYYLLGEPGPLIREVWICCHGYGQLAGRFLRHFEALADGSRLLVAPEALHRFYLDPPDRPAADRRVGATWRTREDRAADIDDYVRYLDAVWQHLRPEMPEGVKLVALGFSQGTATVARWAAAGQEPISTLVLWGSGLPPDLDWSRARARFQQMRVLLVGGKTDPQMPLERWSEQQEFLTSQQIRSEIVLFSGGHRIDSATLQRLA